jgi:hypothetical protein
MASLSTLLRSAIDPPMCYVLGGRADGRDQGGHPASFKQCREFTTWRASSNWCARTNACWPAGPLALSHRKVFWKRYLPRNQQGQVQGQRWPPAGGRESDPPGSKNVANWQTQFFSSRKSLRALIAPSGLEFANRGKLGGKLALSFWQTHVNALRHPRRCPSHRWRMQTGKVIFFLAVSLFETIA